MKIIVTDEGYDFPDEIDNTTAFFKRFYKGAKRQGIHLTPELPECHNPELVVGLCG